MVKQQVEKLRSYFCLFSWHINCFHNLLLLLLFCHWHSATDHFLFSQSPPLSCPQKFHCFPFNLSLAAQIESFHTKLSPFAFSLPFTFVVRFLWFAITRLQAWSEHPASVKYSSSKLAACYIVSTQSIFLFSVLPHYLLALSVASKETWGRC